MAQEVAPATTLSTTAAEVAVDAPGVIPAVWYMAPIGAIAALFMAFMFYRSVMSNTEGEPEMVRIALAVRQGAYAYLRASRRIIIVVFIVLVLILLGISFGLHLQPALSALGVPIAGFFSGLCGYFGMKTATNASARTTAAAKKSLNDGLKVAFRAGAVMGLCVTGFALLDISIWFYVLTQLFPDLGNNSMNTITTIMLSYGMGASLQALFARVGGGIYTKAADVGADLVGKVEAGIPEDDARNPATIADNVGDNVGDVAGMGADLYESYYDSILAAASLAAASAYALGLNSVQTMKLVAAPASLAGLGIICAILGVFLVRTKEGASMKQLLKALHMGVWGSSALIIIGSGILFRYLLADVPGVSWWGVWVAIIAGLVAGLVIAWGTEFYTSYEHKPCQRISEQAQTGPATVIISGIAEGMISTWIPMLTTVAAILVAFIAAGGNNHFLLGVFGVGIAAVGMLSTLAITLATDAYGPIADNAGGNAEMTHQPSFVRERTDMLDSLGNTTAATGKGFAIGSAALTALALLASYVTTVQESLVTTSANTTVQLAGGTVTHGLATLGDGGAVAIPVMKLTLPQVLSLYNVTLMNPMVLCGLFIGVMFVFVFCSLTMNAVGRAAFSMMNECRRQFGIMKAAFKKQGMSDADISDPMKWPFSVENDGHQYPDYAQCVNISTKGALREMIIPSSMAVIIPISVGLILGVAGVMGMLAGALVSGFAMAIFMANAGGAWDNAKKYIETGQLGGKGSQNHKATVVGDTVGDPFKDTSGPSLNILIKLVSIVSVVFAGLIVSYSPAIMKLIGLG
ncbi:MAG: sodium-translocating pyrophosphatase [Phycisphaeraceae bacterium]|nr:sodium-translocating pyrophosphatase [Phycisphaeraceae bacterium]